MNGDLFSSLLGVDRVVTYVGYVLLGGTLMFWTLVWPNGRSERRLVVLAAIGTGMMALGALLEPLARLAIDGGPLDYLVSQRVGAALLVRLAALAAMAFFLVDLAAAAVVGWRRLIAWVVVVVLAGSIVAESDVLEGRLAMMTTVTTGVHVLAAATWLGGLVAIIALLAARDDLEEPERLIPRFSRVTMVSVPAIAVTGIVDASVVAGSVTTLATSTYGLVLLIKVGLFALMLAVSRRGRYHATKTAFLLRYETTTKVREIGVIRSLNTVMATELVLALVVLAATSILVGVTPPP